MWLLKIHLGIMLFTAIPLLANFWFMFSKRGNKFFWMVLGIAFLGLVAAPFFMSDGHFGGVLSIAFKVIMLYVGWVFLSLGGAIVWGIFFVVLEVIRGILAGIGIDLPSPFVFVADNVAKLFDFIDNGFYKSYTNR